MAYLAAAHLRVLTCQRCHRRMFSAVRPHESISIDTGQASRRRRVSAHNAHHHFESGVSKELSKERSSRGR
eukprot:1723469-Rhodomonas_salina.1